MNLTTEARVKVHIEAGGQGLSASSTTGLLNALIASYSEDFEQYMGRVVLSGATTQQFDVDAGDWVFSMAAWPVTTVSSVYNDTDRSWSSGEVDSDNYYMELSSGILSIDGQTLSSGPGVLRVQYTGGMAASTASFIAAYPDIAAACDQQVAYHYQRRQALGAQGLSVGSANVSWVGALDLLPKVKKVLDRHRRTVVA